MAPSAVFAAVSEAVFSDAAASRVEASTLSTGASPSCWSSLRVASTCAFLSPSAGGATADAFTIASQPGAASALAPEAPSTSGRQGASALACLYEGCAEPHASSTSGSLSLLGRGGRRLLGAPASGSCAESRAALAAPLKTSISVCSFSAATVHACACVALSDAVFAAARADSSGTIAPCAVISSTIAAPTAITSAAAAISVESTSSRRVYSFTGLGAPSPDRSSSASGLGVRHEEVEDSR